MQKKLKFLYKGHVIDKSISTLWVRYVEEFCENEFPECCAIGYMRNSNTFAFVFCFEEDTVVKKSKNFDFRYFGRYLLEHELMKWKPIRRLNGNYEKIMNLMSFDGDGNPGSVLYEVKDPDILTLEKENNCLKEALDQANQSVKQISEIFESTKDENQERNSYLMGILSQQEEELSYGVRKLSK